MAKYLPVHIDELFVLSIVLLFLLINYNMPLSNIYSWMTIITIIMYWVGSQFFKWIPFSNKANRFNEIVGGVLAGVGFIYFYKYLQLKTPMAAIFATTAFGESITVGKFVYSTLLPTIETIFFFVVLPLWALWKIGKSIKADLFSTDNIVMGVLFAGIFTIFHTTSKGLTNNMELMVTFVFGLLSIGLIFYFKSVLSAVLAHIIVNGHSVEIIPFLKDTFATSNLMIIVGVIVAFMFLSKNKWRIPLIP